MNIANCVMTFLFSVWSAKEVLYTWIAVFCLSGWSRRPLPASPLTFLFDLVDTVRELLCRMTQSKWHRTRRDYINR